MPIQDILILMGASVSVAIILGILVWVDGGK